MLEDLREGSLQLPRREEERPIDEGPHGGDGGLERSHTGEGGDGEVRGPPVDRFSSLERDPVGEKRRSLPLGVLFAEPVLKRPVLLVEPRLALRIQERAHDPDHARGVGDMDDGL